MASSEPERECPACAADVLRLHVEAPPRRMTRRAAAKDGRARDRIGRSYETARASHLADSCWPIPARPGRLICRAGRSHSGSAITAPRCSGRSLCSSSAAVWVFFMSAREHVVRPLQTMTQSARRLARRRLLDPRARRAGRRRARRSLARNQSSSAKPCACSASAPSKRPRCSAPIMAEIDVAVFTFDPDRRLRLVNRAGENLLGATNRQVARPARERSRPGGVPRCR